VPPRARSFILYRLLAAATGALCMLVGIVFVVAFLDRALFPVFARPLFATDFWGYYLLGFAGAVLFVLSIRCLQPRIAIVSLPLIVYGAAEYLGGRACSLLTFGIKGGFEASKKFYDALKLIKRLVNMGDAKSLACHPASTTHRQMSVDQQRQAGVRPEMIRLNVGIEHVEDIIGDLDQALEAMESD